MCGVFGAIRLNSKAKINYGTLRALAIINRERGTDALGWFNSSGRIYKLAIDPKKALVDTKMNKWLRNSEDHDDWFVCGHTRHGTRGSNTNENAHPYKYDKVVGAHNGCVTAPQTYAVDSQVLFDRLNMCKGDYQAALENIAGYWGLVWSYKNRLYLATHNNELAVVELDGVMYFSSDWQHLEACTGEEAIPMVDGEVICFDGHDYDSSSDKGSKLAAFVSKARSVYNTSATGTGCGYQNYIGSDYDDAYIGSKWNNDTLVNKDYDEDWRSAWTSYQEEHSNIHNLSDNDFEERYGDA